MSVMLNRARIARYTIFHPGYTLCCNGFLPFSTFACIAIPRQRPGRTCKVVPLYACLIRMTAQGKPMTDDRTLQLRVTGFRKAEASLRLEGMDPSGTPLYESVKAHILSGEITYDEGRAEILAYHQKRANDN